MATINIGNLDKDDMKAIFFKQMKRVTLDSLYGTDLREPAAPVGFI